MSADHTVVVAALREAGVNCREQADVVRVGPSLDPMVAYKAFVLAGEVGSFYEWASCQRDPQISAWLRDWGYTLDSPDDLLEWP